MLRPRIIPCLLVRNGGLVKTVEFKDEKYVGDPLNAVRIFNEKHVDELIVLDIDATVQEREPDFKLISELASECRMPLCYGGGVKTAEQASRIIGLGVEKVALSSAAVYDPELVFEISTQVGSQSTVVVMDIAGRRMRGPELKTHNGTKGTGISPLTFAQEMEQRGAGELVVNSIDRDGERSGYDIELAKRLKETVQTPVTVLGGAGSLQHIEELIQEIGIVGAAAGSLFVFKGPYRAVLINYPKDEFNR